MIKILALLAGTGLITALAWPSIQPYQFKAPVVGIYYSYALLIAIVYLNTIALGSRSNKELLTMGEWKYYGSFSNLEIVMGKAFSTIVITFVSICTTIPVGCLMTFIASLTWHNLISLYLNLLILGVACSWLSIYLEDIKNEWPQIAYLEFGLILVFLLVCALVFSLDVLFSFQLSIPLLLLTLIMLIDLALDVRGRFFN